MARWKKNVDSEQLIQLLESIKIISKNGKVSFSAFEFSIYKTILYGLIEFPESIPEIEGIRIAKSALFEVGKNGNITQKKLISAITNLENRYMQQPQKRYVITTSVSINRDIKLDRIYFGRTQIVFEPTLTNAYKRETADLTRQAKNVLFTDPPNNYMAVRVHVTAKSDTEAVDSGLNSLDLIRGIWNLYENNKHLRRMSFGSKPLPVNKIILGPYHFLHLPNGKLIDSDRWWYDRSYLAPVSLFGIKDLKKLKSFESWIRQKIQSCSYGNVLEKAIIRYSRALDERNWENAYIKLWGVLELITDTVKVSQEITVRRAAYLYKEVYLVLQSLKQLQDYRNRSVHADGENHELEDYLYQLKRIVEELILFHVNAVGQFKNMQQAGSFLDLPRDKDALEIRERLVKYAKKFRQYE